jgi:hypothetical protein
LMEALNCAEVRNRRFENSRNGVLWILIPTVRHSSGDILNVARYFPKLPLEKEIWLCLSLE